MIVAKAVKMAGMLNIPVLGIVENMSYFDCPDCGRRHEIFGASQVDAAAKEFGVPHTARLPVDPAITAKVDAGKVEEVDGSLVSAMADSLEQELPLQEEE